MLLDDLSNIRCGDGLPGWSWEQGGDVEGKGGGKEPGQGTKQEFISEFVRGGFVSSVL